MLKLCLGVVLGWDVIGDEDDSWMLLVEEDGTEIEAWEREVEVYGLGASF